MSSQRPTLPPLHTLLLPSLPVTMDNDNETKRSYQYARQRQLSVSSSVTASSQERTPSLSPPPQHSELSSFSSDFSIQTPSPSPSPTLRPRSLPIRRLLFSSSARDERRNRRVRSRIDASGTVPNNTFRLVPTTLATADAVLFVPTPSAMASLSAVPSISRFSREKAAATSMAEHKDGMDVDSSASSINPGAVDGGNGKALLLVGSVMRKLRSSPNLRTQLARGARILPYKIVWNTPGAVPPVSAAAASRISLRTASHQ